MHTGKALQSPGHNRRGMEATRASHGEPRERADRVQYGWDAGRWHLPWVLVGEYVGSVLANTIMFVALQGEDSVLLSTQGHRNQGSQWAGRSQYTKEFLRLIFPLLPSKLCCFGK